MTKCFNKDCAKNNRIEGLAASPPNPLFRQDAERLALYHLIYQVGIYRVSKTSILLFFLGWAQLSIGQTEYIDVTTTAGLLPKQGCEGVAVGDFNNDGYDDFYVSFPQGKNQFYRNNGDRTFTEMGEELGIVLPDFIDTRTAAWGDINNDGWVDLYLGNKGTSDQLYLNLKNEQFQNISHKAGINAVGHPKSVNMADVNGDGLLDIYVANFASENVLYLNQGDTTFLDANLEAGALDKGRAMGSVLFDYDKDGDVDIYLVHDGNEPNFLYQNDGTGKFREVAQAAGVATESYGMGVDIGDINNDGWMDIHITNLGPNFLLLNNGDGTFQNISKEANIDDIGMGWGTNFLDFDKDGLLDIYVANDSKFSPFVYRNILYQNLGNRTFERTEVRGVVSNDNSSYGSAYFDYDLDGNLDLLVVNREEGIHLYENSTRTNNWLGLKLIGTESNTNAIGATIQLLDEKGSIYCREIIAGHSWESQSTLLQHIGIGTANSIKELTIYWPSGNIQKEVITELNQYYTISESGTIEKGINLDQTTSTNSITSTFSNIHIAPNPNNGNFIIEWKARSAEPLSLQVLDLLGKSFYTQRIKPIIGKNKITIHLDNKNFASSLLMIRISNQAGKQINKRMVLIK